MSKQDNPLSNLFTQIEQILDFIVIKNGREADRYETKEMVRDAALYYQAVLQQDSWLSYSDYYEANMFVEITPTVKREFIRRWMESPYSIPLVYRDHIRDRCRKIVVDSYEERNNYYRMLAGLPPLEAPEHEFIMVPEKLRASIYAGKILDDLPIHELPMYEQDIIVQDQWFETVLAENPDKEYLRFLGKRSIDPIVARPALDFQLIRYIPMENSFRVNPYLVKEFSSIYNEYRDYYMLTIYNRELEKLFPGYRAFMGLLITAAVISQVCHRAVESCNTFRFLDDKVISIIFAMYGIPRDIIVTMATTVQRDLVCSLLKLIRKKATNVVFYDLIRILGYTDVTISKLLLMKEQYYDEDSGQARFADGNPIETFLDLDKLLRLNEQTTTEKEVGLVNILDPETDELDWEFEADFPFRGLPVFQPIDLKDPNPYRTIVREENPAFDYFTITSRDPRWWDLQDTRNLIRNKNYTNADSKYIMVESLLKDTVYLYEVVYFTRMILDYQDKTAQMMFTVPELFGSTKVSLFDLMVFILAAMCYNNGMDGTILTSASGLLAIAGFNFGIDMGEFRRFLETTEYADRERIMMYLNNTTMTTPGSINQIFTEVMLPFKDWMTDRMANCLDREEYLEYEKVFRSCYSYDIAQQVFVHDFLSPIDVIKARYHVSEEEMLDFKLFYPHHPDGIALTVETFPDSPYDPFLGTSAGQDKTWYVQTGCPGTEPYDDCLYLFDILNSPDIRYVTDENGETIPNPVLWDPVNGCYDQHAIEAAITAIRGLSMNQLGNAYFKVNTARPGYDTFRPGVRYDDQGRIVSFCYLPESIRAEGIFQEILVDKLSMDMRGEAIPPQTYLEYLRRRNPMLSDLFKKATVSKTDWMNTITIIVLTIEAELNMHLKVWEHAVLGTEFYFRPLVTLIKHFKSYMIDFCRCGVRYLFDSRIDPGGGSNMLKLFDSIWQAQWHTYPKVEMGLFDAEYLKRHHWLIQDRTEMITDNPTVPDPDNPEGPMAVSKRQSSSGSIRLVDEAKFYLNGKEIDPPGPSSSPGPQFWYQGEDSIGRFDDELDRQEAGYDHVMAHQEPIVDTEGWKDFVESFSPTE
jgi:hypothetical protein